MSDHGIFSTGDSVCVQGQVAIGTVTRISKQTATVAFPTFNLKISVDKLTQAPSAAQASSAAPARSGSRLLNKDPYAYINFEDAIDLHGMRAHEALAALDQWMDQAYLLGRKHLKVIHGKGDGVLRHAVGKHLRKHSWVKRVIDKHPFPGGAGVTWIELA
ncbi:MAG: Smr/MutS family protein [Bacteroidota bacterium]